MSEDGDYIVNAPGMDFLAVNDKDSWRVLLEALNYHFDKNEGIRKDGAKVRCSDCDKHVTLDTITGLWRHPTEDRTVVVCNDSGCQIILSMDRLMAEDKEDDYGEKVYQHDESFQDSRK